MEEGLLVDILAVKVEKLDLISSNLQFHSQLSLLKSSQFLTSEKASGQVLGERDQFLAQCEVCQEHFSGKSVCEVRNRLNSHRSNKHYDKMLEFTFFQRRIEPGVSFRTKNIFVLQVTVFDQRNLVQRVSLLLPLRRS